MDCIIIDDEEMARTSLRLLCSKIKDLKVKKDFDNAVDALKYLQSHQVDLVFLDVEMPEFTGFDLVKSSTELPYIIFVTSRSDYAAEAFEFKELVVDFITKPVTLPRLIKAVERMRQIADDDTQNLVKTTEYIFVKTDRRYVRIDLSDLLYIETVGDYVKFKTSSDQFIVHSTLKNVDSQINHPDFLKVHRSYIVNLSKVKDIEDNTLVIERTVIPVSRAQKPILLKRIAAL